MKKFIIYTLVLVTAGLIWSCKKDGNYPGGTVSPYISLYDIRNSFKGNELTLTKENMFGADKIYVIVTSDHSGGNLPQDLLMVQDSRRLNRLRGIAIPTPDAETYLPGDSLIIKVEGKTIKRVDGILQLTGVTGADISKVSTGNPIVPSIVRANQILESPESYEGTLVSITSAGFDPSYPPGSTYAGDKVVNDGFGNLTIFTDPGASFANNTLPYLSNFTGIVYLAADGTPRLRPRTINDITILTATPPKIAAMVITGYLTDPSGSDANHEYIQFKATRNIDFAVTPFAVVTTNNAGSATPTGFPANGWATGGTRTYKFNLTAGTVQAGEYFYVGANTKIWGSASTDVGSTSKWFGKQYGTDPGDGFGNSTSNLLANSGNAGGIAVFDSIDVHEGSVPVDVIFYGGNGSLYTAGPPQRGYRITSTDYYDVVNPIDLSEQPFFAMGSNTGKFSFPTTGNFTQLGGTYNKSTGRWTQARMQQNVPLTTTSVVTEIEGATTIEQ